MKLVKIIPSIIPTMYNAPCQIAIFTDGKKCKVFQKDFFGWRRNVNLEVYKTPTNIEQKLREIEADGKARYELRVRISEQNRKSVEKFTKI